MRWFDFLMRYGPRGLRLYVQARYIHWRNQRSGEPSVFELNDLDAFRAVPPFEMLFYDCVFAVAEGQIPSPAIVTADLLLECSPDPVQEGLAERACQEAYARLTSYVDLRRRREGLSYFHCGTPKGPVTVVVETKGPGDPMRMTAFSPFRFRLFDLKKRLDGWRPDRGRLERADSR